jgi:hypothetical protein
LPAEAPDAPGLGQVAYGRGCGKRVEGAMACPRPVGSQLRCRKTRNGPVSRREVERRGCLIVMAITFHLRWGGLWIPDPEVGGPPGAWG